MCVLRGQGSCHGKMDRGRRAKTWACTAQSSKQHQDVASSCIKIHLSFIPFPHPLFVSLVFLTSVFLTGQESFHTVPCRELLNNAAIESDFSAQVMKFIIRVFYSHINCDTDS